MLGIQTTDRLNPVFLKEMRQSIRSRTLRNLLIAMAVAEIIGFYWWITLNATPDGITPLYYLYLLATLGLTVAASFPICSRAGRENGNEGLDANLCSQLTPWEIVLGKSCAAWLSAALILVVSLPLWLTIHAPFQPVPLALYLLGLPAMLQCSLWLSLIRAERQMKGAGVLGLVGFLMPAVGGIGLIFGSERRQLPLEIGVCLIALEISLVILTTVFAVAILKKPHSDRAKPAWIAFFAVLAAWLIFLTQVPFAPEKLQNAGHIPAVGIWAKILFSMLPWVWLTASAERLDATPRMIAEEPKQRWKRILSIPVTGGAANGFWAGIVLLWLGVAAAQIAGVPTATLKTTLIAPFYVLFYSALIVLLRRNWHISIPLAFVSVLLAMQLPLLVVWIQQVPAAVALTTPIFGLYEEEAAFNTSIFFALTGAILWLREYRTYRRNRERTANAHA